MATVLTTGVTFLQDCLKNPGPVVSRKQQLLKQVRNWGLTNQRGKPLTSQAIGVLLWTSPITVFEADAATSARKRSAKMPFCKRHTGS